MAFTQDQEVSDIQNRIGAITDLDALRNIREFADQRVQDIKEAKSEAEKTELEAKYKGKYALIYGRTVSLTHSEPNKNEFRIVHILDIEFKGHGFFRCKAKIIHIKFDDEWGKIRHLTGDWGSSYISYCEDEQYDINEDDIDEIIDKARADELVTSMVSDFNEIAGKWDI